MYVLVDVGNPKRVANILSMHRANKRLGIPCPELVVVDAKPRSAASTYDIAGLDMEELLSEMPTWEDMSGMFSGFSLDDVTYSTMTTDSDFDLSGLIDKTEKQMACGGTEAHVIDGEVHG